MWYHNAEIGHLMRHVATLKRRRLFFKNNGWLDRVDFQIVQGCGAPVDS